MTVQASSLRTDAETSTTLLNHLARLGVVPRGVSDDSRRLQAGDLFLAYPGDLADGRRHIGEAITAGAAAVLWDPAVGSAPFTWNDRWQIVNLPVAGLRQLRGPLAHAVYGWPSERLSLIAITGTNGKTSIGQWIAQAYPRRCASMGTLGAGFAGQLVDTGLTTPEATTLARCLADFADAEAQACTLEASSIGIAEGRLDGTRVDVAVFTNLTRDHLDYHRSMAAYAQAKARLFTWPRLRLAVINIDDPFGHQLASMTTASKVLVCTQREQAGSQQATLRAENVEQTVDGLRFRLSTPVGRALVETGLVGHYNVANLLAVAAVLTDAGLTPKAVAECFADLRSPAGRLEKLGGVNQPLVIVDYAHTPDALENALLALRPLATARGAALVVIFGCGGDRDPGKRPLMGAIAARLADRVVLTSDNPRSEDEGVILDAIRVAAPQAEVIADRALAIRQTLIAAPSADVILIAGKGHEAYQETRGVRRPFSDTAEARKALAARPLPPV